MKEPADGCGGETFLVKNREILSKLDPEVVRNFEQKHIRYTRYLPDKSRMDYVHLNWQNLFTTDSKKVFHLFNVGVSEFERCPTLLIPVNKTIRNASVLRVTTTGRWLLVDA